VNIKAAVTVVVVVILLVAPVFGPARMDRFHGLVYPPAKRQLSELLKVDLPRNERPATSEVVHYVQPPTDNELVRAIAQQDVREGIRAIAVRRWKVRFAFYSSSNEGENYSAIATRKGAPEYYYSIKRRVVPGGVLVWISPPITICACADGTMAYPESACSDGSQPKAVLGR
jgi:hypothetical protein